MSTPSPAPFVTPGNCVLCGIPAVSSQDSICNYCIRIALQVSLNQALTPANILAYLAYSSMQLRIAANATTVSPTNPGLGVTKQGV